MTCAFSLTAGVATLCVSTIGVTGTSSAGAGVASFDKLSCLSF